MSTDIEKLIKDKSEVNKQIMRELDIVTEKLNEAGEGDFVGCANGWDYSFTRRKAPEPQQKESLN